MLTLCSVIVYICMCTCIVYTLRSNNVKCQCNINPRPTSKFSIKGTFFKKFRLVFAAISVKTFPSERRGWAWCKLDGKGCYSEVIPPPPPPARGEQPYSGERQQRPRRPDRVAAACRLQTAPAPKHWYIPPLCSAPKYIAACCFSQPKVHQVTDVFSVVNQI